MTCGRKRHANTDVYPPEKSEIFFFLGSFRKCDFLEGHICGAKDQKSCFEPLAMAEMASIASISVEHHLQSLFGKLSDLGMAVLG
jgi:hypothetical protein